VLDRTHEAIHQEGKKNSPSKKKSLCGNTAARRCLYKRRLFFPFDMRRLVLFALVASLVVGVQAEGLRPNKPPILTVPLTREGSPAARVLARASSSADVQRILDLRAAAATTTPITGCPFGNFAVPVVLNATSFQLILDTGSATLAVAGATCDNCRDVTPLWRPSPGASVNQSHTAISIYGDGSSWQANVWRDRVTLASTPVDMRIAVINHQVRGNTRAPASRALVSPFHPTAFRFALEGTYEGTYDTSILWGYGGKKRGETELLARNAQRVG
jgi:hypothetical protein